MTMTIQERFEQFHKSNPEVYRVLRGLARMVKSRGYERYGIGSLFERLRWHFEFERPLAGDFKVNNDYRSRYARLLMEQEPEFRGFFETRELKAK